MERADGRAERFGERNIRTPVIQGKCGRCEERENLTAVELNDLTYNVFWGVKLMRAFKDSVLPFPGESMNR